LRVSNALSLTEKMLLLEKRLATYKPMYRAWLGSTPVVNTCRPEHAEILLNSTKHLDKSMTYRFLHTWLGTGLLTSTGQKWHIHRKMITPTFHFKILENFMEIFSEKSEILVKKLEKEIGSQGFDVYPYITRCALDIICETAMGTPLNAQDDTESPYVSAVYSMSELTLWRMVCPWLHPDFLFRLSSSGKKYNECLNIVHSFTNKVIRERKADYKISLDSRNGNEDQDLGRKRRVAFLDMLIEASESGTKLTDEELREEVDTFMFEGHDTTSAAMCWALCMLGLYPEYQEKAYEEQENIFQGSNRPANTKDANEMKYLECVIKETLRLFPSVPGIGRTTTEDIQLDGFVVPEGSTVHVHIYHLHRNPQHFPNPEKFDPDNFLPDRVVNRHPYAYIPFSAGPRNCIGQKFALLEEKTVLSYILRNYKWSCLDKREDIKILAELVLRPENGIRLEITKRDNKRL
ncbi:Cytochrome P450 4C1, partial [Periplaneta americana]